MAAVPNHPDAFSLEIKDVSEKAFQRALWLCGHSQIGGTTVSWLDIELPVDMSGKPRGQCLDMIGIDNTGHYVIGETKFGDSASTDSPMDAADQIRGYKEEIERHAGVEGHDLGHHWQAEERGGIDWQAVADVHTRLVIAANDAYWRYWCGHRGVALPQGVECYALPVDPLHFKKQRGTQDSYEPGIEEHQNQWRQIREIITLL